MKKTKDELEDLKKTLDVVKEDAMKMSIAELSERESNCNNVIIHRVPESENIEPTERQAHDFKMLKIILKELGLLNYINAELREDVKFVRRIGEKKENQEARPMKVGFKLYSNKERLMESARLLNEIPNLKHISIANDLTELQRKEETTLWRKAGEQNLVPSEDMLTSGSPQEE